MLKFGFRILPLLLALIFFASCYKGEPISGKQNSLRSDPEQQSEKKSKDNEIFCYYYGEGSLDINVALPRFCLKHPDLEIEQYKIDSDLDAYQQLQVELMSGKGPDVIINPTAFTNLYKAMDSGIFLCLSELLTESGLNPLEYNENLLFAGSLKDRLYVIPLCYTQPLIMTLEDTLLQFGVGNKDMDSIDGILEVFENIQNGGTRLFAHTDIKFTFLYLAQCFFPCAFDYSKNTLQIDNEAFNRFIEIMKKEYTLYGKWENHIESSYQGQSLAIDIANKKAAFMLTYSIYSHCIRGAELSQFGPISFYSIPGFQGEAAALAGCFVGINANTRFLEESWDFVELLLDGTTQSYIATDIIIPIRNANAQAQFDMWDNKAQNFIVNGTFPNIAVDVKIPDGIAEVIEYNASKITVAVFNTNDYEMLFDFFESYIIGNKEYKNCLAEATNYFRIIFSE